MLGVGDGQLGSTSPGVHDGVGEVGGCDVGGCDVGGCEVGGCEVGGCEVGGCDVVVVVRVGVCDADGVVLDGTGVSGALISCLLGSGRVGLPDRKVSMKIFHVLPGRSRPYSGLPFASTIGRVELPLPTHTAALTCGVNPTIQASLLPPLALPTSMPSVPVLAADGRPPASASPENAAIGSRVSVTSLATLLSSACVGAALCL